MPVSVSYQGNVENQGMTDWKKDGERCGTTGKGLRLEGVYVKLETDEDLGLELQGHIQDIGWGPIVKDGELCGTIDQSKRLEAIKIKLTGSAAYKYSVIYGVHVQNVGDMQTAMDGEAAGTEGFSERIEAIQIWVVEKGVDFKVETMDSFRKAEPAPEPTTVPEEQPAPAPSGRLGLRYFDEDNEFKCKCGCGLDVKDEVKIMADNARDEYGFPLVVSSGARCAYQNEIDGGIPNSNHTKGEAVDLYAPGRMSYDEVDNLANVMANNGFGVILYHENLFVHGDEDGEYWSMN